MKRNLIFSLVIGACLVAGDSRAQNRGNDRGQGPGGDRGGFGGPGGDRGRGGPPGGPPGGGGDRRGGGRPKFMQFLPVLVALDADKNGEISSQELENATAALKALDKNKDGKLTEDEVRPERPPGGRGRGGQGGGDRGRGGFGGSPGGDRSGQGDGGMRRPNAAETAKRMMAFDKNKDGKLTKDEVSERMHPLLKEADANGDGAASREEITKLAEKRVGGQSGRDRGGRGGGDQGGGTLTPQRPQFDK
ncbi:MAG: hypothetical protein ACPGVU_13975 [Limisphaerales bacterium]